MKKGVEVIKLMGETFPAEEIVNAVRGKAPPEAARALVEGGGALFPTLISDGFIDELVAALAPIMLGESCVSMFPKIISEPLKLRLISVYLCTCSQEVVLKYKVSSRVL